MQAIPINKATTDHFVNNVSLFLIPYISPIMEDIGIPIENAKKPNRRKVTSIMAPITIKIFVLIYIVLI